MAEYENPDLGVSFTIPDQLTVREQLAFYSAVRVPQSGQEYERYWSGFLQIVDNWECEALPDPSELDLDEATDPAITPIVIWCGGVAVGHFNRLEDVPKN